MGIPQKVRFDFTSDVVKLFGDGNTALIYQYTLDLIARQEKFGLGEAECAPISVKTLEENLGISRHKINKALKVCQDKNLLFDTNRRGVHNARIFTTNPERIEEYVEPKKRSYNTQNLKQNVEKDEVVVENHVEESIEHETYEPPYEATFDYPQRKTWADAERKAKEEEPKLDLDDDEIEVVAEVIKEPVTMNNYDHLQYQGTLSRFGIDGTGTYDVCVQQKGNKFKWQEFKSQSGEDIVRLLQGGYMIMDIDEL